MFFKTKKPDYESICASPSLAQEYIYGDRSKTSEILEDKDFVRAWLANLNPISALIITEARNGDIPSIKQMIWLSDWYYENASAISESKELEIQVCALVDKISFCEMAMKQGLKEKSYEAMTSCFAIYNLLVDLLPSSDARVRDSLAGIVRYAKLFLSSGHSDPDLITDAENLIAVYEKFSELVGESNTHVGKVTARLA